METDTNTGVVTGANDVTADVGGGVAASDSRPDDVTAGPWNKDPRFKEFYGEYKTWKEHRERIPEYVKASQELEQWRKGEHPSEIAWAGQIRDLVVEEHRAEVERELAEAGLLEAYKRMKAGKPVAQEDKKDVNAIVRDEITKFKDEFTKEQEAKQIDATLSSQFKDAMAASPYKDVKGFQAKCLAFVKNGIMTDYETTGKYKPVSEYVSEIEQLFDEAYGVTAKKRAAPKAPKTLTGTGVPAGMSRREMLEQQKAALLAEMRGGRE